MRNRKAIATDGYRTISGSAVIATDPIAQQILENVVLTLQSIVAGSEYTYTLAEVKMNDGKLSGFFSEFSSFPSADVFSWEESVDEETEEQFSICEMLVKIGLYTDEREDIDAALGCLIADAIKALKVDRTRGGLASDTIVTRKQKIITTEIGGSATGLADVSFRIRYRHYENDPYTQ